MPEPAKVETAKTCAIITPEAMPPRTRQDLINLRRQLKGTLEFIEIALRKEGVKVELTQ